MEAILEPVANLFGAAWPLVWTLAKIIGIIDRDYVVEGALRRQIQQNIARLRDIGSFLRTLSSTGRACR